MSGNTGDRVGLRAYSPFGEITQDWNQAPTEGRGLYSLSEYWPEPISCRAAGERHDRDAGLLYLNARYHEPELGMFPQPDWFEWLCHPTGASLRSALSSPA